MSGIFDEISEKHKKLKIKPDDVHQESLEEASTDEKESTQKIEVINNIHFDEIDAAVTTLTASVKDSTTVQKEIVSFIKIYGARIADSLNVEKSLGLASEKDRHSVIKHRLPLLFLLVLLGLILINIGIGIYLVRYSPKNNGINYDKIILNLENRINKLEDGKKSAEKKEAKERIP